jgi:hypothetical protein
MEVDSLNWVNIHLKHARYRNSVAQWLRRCATNQKAAGSILRKIPARIPNEWLLRPQFYLWPPQRQRAVLWVLSRFVTFRLHRQRGPTFRDLMDFLRRSRWKMYQSTSRRWSVANFLTVLDNTWLVVTTLPEGTGPYEWQTTWCGAKEFVLPECFMSGGVIYCLQTSSILFCLRQQYEGQSDERDIDRFGAESRTYLLFNNYQHIQMIDAVTSIFCR